MSRFSKANLIEKLQDQAEYLENKYNFDPNNGTDQLKTRSAEVWMAYGKYDTYNNLIMGLQVHGI